MEKDKITEQKLLDEGFQKFSPSRIDPDSVERCYQKRYDDETGIKYFITIRKWKGWIHPYTGEKAEPAYECSTQLYQKDTHNALDLTFHSSWTLEDVEKYLESLFDTGMYDYYEKFL